MAVRRATARSQTELRLLRQTTRESGWRIEPVTESISFRAIAIIESHAFSLVFRQGVIGLDAIQLLSSRTLGISFQYNADMSREDGIELRRRD